MWRAQGRHRSDQPCARLTDDGPRLEEQSTLHRAFLESGIGRSLSAWALAEPLSPLVPRFKAPSYCPAASLFQNHVPLHDVSALHPLGLLRLAHPESLKLVANLHIQPLCKGITHL